ncbi:MAG TPA: peptidase [Planctomycetaceae bacterium]|nr:peptidase [Planctomycetaceae bacterium]HRE99902.1 PepSY-associated TM helix domain-containing protein [Pirellulaceae bacterium]
MSLTNPSTSASETVSPSSSISDRGEGRRGGSASPKPLRRRTLYAASAAAFRWVHLYVSMLGFSMLMFFAFTGMTLNHPTWFGAGEQQVEDRQGALPAELAAALKPKELSSAAAAVSSESSEERSTADGVDKLALAEFVRAEHRLSGAVKEFEVDEFECMLVFKGPGYSADVFVDREQGTYTVTETTTGLMAILNDLHKGRDSGPEWALLIDVSAVATMLLSLSGFGLLLYLKRRRLTGVVTAVVGTVLLFVVWAVWVP